MTSARLLSRFISGAGAGRLLPALAYPLALLAVAACGAGAVDNEPGAKISDVPESPAASHPVVWGKADLEPTDAINKWQPTVDYLASQLSHVGIDSGEMKIAPDAETLGQWMAAGEVDLMVDSFYPAMIISEHSSGVPLAVRLTGKPAKHAVFFARVEDNLDSLSDLSGQTVAFAEPDSTSGFMLPLAHLREMGLQTAEVSSAEAAAGPDEIGYVFAGDDDVVATWVLEGRVTAGAVDHPTFDDFEAGNPGKLAVLSRTGSISSDNVVLVRRDLDPALAAAIKAALLSMAGTPEGQEVLAGTKTRGFGEFLQEVAAEWDKAREKYLLIQD